MAWVQREQNVTGFVATVASDHQDNITHHYQGSWIRNSASLRVVLLPQLLIALRMLIPDLVEYSQVFSAEYCQLLLPQHTHLSLSTTKSLISNACKYH